MLLLRFISAYVVQSYSCTDSLIAWKNSRFILHEISDFQMIDRLSIAVPTFPVRMLTSLLVDEILLPRCVSLSPYFRGLPLNVEMAPSCLKNMNCFIWVHIETNTSSCLFQVIHPQIYTMWTLSLIFIDRKSNYFIREYADICPWECICDHLKLTFNATYIRNKLQDIVKVSDFPGFSLCL